MNEVLNDVLSENNLFITLKYDGDDSYEMFKVLSDNDVKMMFDRNWTNKEVDLHIDTHDITHIVMDYSVGKNKSKKFM